MAFFFEPGWAEDWQQKTFRQRAGRQLYKQSGKEREREREGQRERDRWETEELGQEVKE